MTGHAVAPEVVLHYFGVFFEAFTLGVIEGAEAGTQVQASQIELPKGVTLVSDPELRDRIFSRLRREWQSTLDSLLTIMGQQVLLESNPLLARSIRNRFPYLDPLNHMQIELLKRYRAGDASDDVVTGIHLTINGLAAGLRNSG